MSFNGRVGQVLVALWVIYMGVVQFVPTLSQISVIAAVVAVIGGALWIANK